MGRPSKYHFDKLLEIEQPAVGHFYGEVETIRSAAQGWARSRGAKIKTAVYTDKDTGSKFLQVLITEVPNKGTN